MAIYRVASKGLERVAETTFSQEKMLERRDLQRLLRADISILAPDAMLIAEEFGDWEDSNRRIDLLCLDKQARLVVIELKRTQDGGHMELQALRYAAMVSSMTFEQLVAAHARFIGAAEGHPAAETAILGFLGWDSSADGSLSSEVRILLVSAEFSLELTTTVLWLNKRDLDITCIRLKPYSLDGNVLIDVQQLIPLPEAAEYETRVRAQEQEGRRAVSTRQDLFRRFWQQLIDRSRSQTSLMANRHGTVKEWLSVSLGRQGFSVGLVLLEEENRVECYIDLGKGLDDQNLTALNDLKAQRKEIEALFGGQLDWQELDDARACRIRTSFPGGWRTPESDWPTLQDSMIGAMLRLERAIKPAIQSLRLPEN